MKLYNSVGPNPKVVRMYIAELGIEIEKQEVDLMAGENRQAAYMELNPTGTMPALELDDGSVISEITALCEYLDEKQGHTPLLGTTAEERAETRMWCRRIDLGILENLANGFRSSEGLELFKDRIHTIPHAADDLKAIAQEKITWLDGIMGGNDYVCGDRFSLADIMLFCFLEFGAQVGQPLNKENSNIVAWYDRVVARDSASA
ncbi:MAG: glutathione S-transferase family protein [Gammaproteobacteria bacterium]|nr:glutathione S-transferase family protein [Gammaproteobacteria bacterium]